MSSGPLKGVRLVDASAGAVGPWAGMLLGQLGATVIKLEAPSGDFIRAIMPAQNGLSTTYMSMNPNKRGLTLDMKDKGQRAEAHALIAGADMFLENFRPGVTDRIGLGWAELSRLNPRLIYLSASGFGWSGPMVEVGATDPHIQAFSGSTSVNGIEGSQRQRVRMYGGFDMNTGLCIVQGALAALLERETSGKGRLVRITMIEAAMAMQRVRLAEHFSGGRPRPMGTAITYLAPDRMFQALDGMVSVSATSEAQWQGFCRALDRAELAADVRFASNALRVQNRKALDELLDPIFAARSIGHWLREMARHGVPAAKPTSFDEYRHNVHYLENRMLGQVACPTGGTFTLGGTPWQFQRNPVAVTRPPLPGEHSDAIRAGGWAALEEGEA